MTFYSWKVCGKGLIYCKQTYNCKVFVGPHQDQFSQTQDPIAVPCPTFQVLRSWFSRICRVPLGSWFLVFRCSVWSHQDPESRFFNFCRVPPGSHQGLESWLSGMPFVCYLLVQRFSKTRITRKQKKNTEVTKITYLEIEAGRKDLLCCGEDQ